MPEKFPSFNEAEKIQDQTAAEEAAYAEKPFRDERRLFGMLGPSKANLREGDKAAEDALKQFEENFYPGRLSRSGFLAEGERLDGVIARDKATCERLGVTPKQIGEAIEKLLQNEGRNDFTVITEYQRGKQESPFDHKDSHPFSNMTFRITNKKTGESFEGPGLIVHFLKDHSFFEGNTNNRVDPEQAIKVLFEKTLEAKIAP